jgi:hypothetical protein
MAHYLGHFMSSFSDDSKFCTEFQIGNVNWDMIQIKDKLDDLGKLEFACEEQLYLVLGLKGEDECEKQ